MKNWTKNLKTSPEKIYRWQRNIRKDVPFTCLWGNANVNNSELSLCSNSDG